jgi:hypothetical protein
MMPIPELSEPSSANTCGIGEADINNRLEQGHQGTKGRCRPMLGLKSTVSATRYFRGYDELRNFLRCQSHMRQHLPAAVRRWRHMRNTACPRSTGDSWRRWPKLTELNGARTDRTHRDKPLAALAGKSDARPRFHANSPSETHQAKLAPQSYFSRCAQCRRSALPRPCQKQQCAHPTHPHGKAHNRQLQHGDLEERCRNLLLRRDSSHDSSAIRAVQNNGTPQDQRRGR